MNGLILRLIGGALGLALLATCGWLIKDRFHQKELAEAAATCAVAAADQLDAAPLDRCLSRIADEVRAARRERLCERTLLPSLRDETRFAMYQSCGSGVKRLVAAMDAASDERGEAQQQLAAARLEMSTAVARAERRTNRSNERESHGRTVIQAAPRGAGGIIRCDAECLLRLAQ